MVELVRQKNVATYIVFPLVDASGVLQSSATGLTETYDQFSDGSAPDGFAACANAATERDATGYYYLSLTQAEMNADYIIVSIASNEAVTQTILIRTMDGDPLKVTTSTNPTTDVDNILVDTAEIQGKLPDNNIMGSSVTTDKDDEIDAIKAKTDNLPADPASETNVNANETKIDAVQSDVTAIKTKTDNLPVNTATELTDIDGAIAALNDLSSADVQTVLENNDLDHIAKVAHPSGDPVADTLLDLIMNKDGGQTFNRATDSLESLGEDADAIKAKTDNLPADPASETNVNANETKIDTMQGNVTDILADTNETQGKLPTNKIMGSANVNDYSDDIEAIAAAIAALNDLSSADVQTVLENNDLDHLAKIAHPSGDPVADTLFDLIMNKDAGQTFNRATDSLEGIVDGGGGGTDWDANQKTEILTVLGITGTGTPDSTPSDGVLKEIQDNVDAVEGKIDTIDGIVDTILIDTNEIQGKLPVNNIADQTLIDADLTNIETDTQDIQSKIGTPPSDLYTDLKSEIDGNETKIDAVKTDTAAILSDTDTIEADLKTYMDTKETNIIAEVDANEVKIDALNDPSSADIADAVWDEILTGVVHNTVNSAGRRLRELSEAGVLHTGQAQAGGNNTITLAATASGDNDFYRADIVVIIGGTGVGQARTIYTYDGGTKVATVICNWITNPDNSSEYNIVSASEALVGLLCIGAVAQVNGEVDTALTDIDLDHLLKVAHPSGDPVANSIMDLVMNKDGGQTFDRSTDSLEAQADAGGTADFTANERTEIKTILGVTGTGTPQDAPSDGSIKKLQDDLTVTESNIRGADSDDLKDISDQIDALVVGAGAWSVVEKNQALADLTSLKADLGDASAEGTTVLEESKKDVVPLIRPG